MKIQERRYCQNPEHRPRFAQYVVWKNGERVYVCRECHDKHVAITQKEREVVHKWG